jgi:tetratricopeptide (TPR) repeat protein
VAQGIAHAKQGNYQEAMKCYAQALEVDPKHRDAFVARGAAYANKSMLEAAVKEFQTALAIDPHDANAQKYLKATQQKVTS